MWRSKRAWDLIALSVTLFLASFSQVVTGLPPWFAWMPVFASAAITAYLATGAVWERFFGEGQYVLLEEAAAKMIPKMSQSVRNAIARLMSKSEKLKPETLASLVTLLDAPDRPKLFGRTQKNMALELIPSDDLDRMHQVTEGSIICLHTKEVLWMDVSLRRTDCRKLLQFLSHLYKDYVE